MTHCGVSETSAEDAEGLVVVDIGEGRGGGKARWHRGREGVEGELKIRFAATAKKIQKKNNFHTASRAMPVKAFRRGTRWKVTARLGQWSRGSVVSVLV